MGFLKSLMPQEHKFKLFTSDIAVVQRKMSLANQYKPAPLDSSWPWSVFKSRLQSASALPNHAQGTQQRMCGLAQSGVVPVS